MLLLLILQQMDLIIPEDFKSNEKILESYNFLKTSYMNYLLSNPKLMNQLLNDYIQLMFVYHKDFGNRINRFSKRSLGNYLSPQCVPFYHIYEFAMHCISKDYKYDMNLFKDFYGKLLQFADDTLGFKFIFGTNFTSDQNRQLLKKWKNSEKNPYKCSFSKIKFKLPLKTISDKKLNLFKENKKFTFPYKIKNTTKFIWLTIDNTNFEFKENDLWLIQECCKYAFYTTSIDYKKSTDDILYIKMISIAPELEKFDIK